MYKKNRIVVERFSWDYELTGIVKKIKNKGDKKIVEESTCIIMQSENYHLQENIEGLYIGNLLGQTL